MSSISWHFLQFYYLSILPLGSAQHSLFYLIRIIMFSYACFFLFMEVTAVIHACQHYFAHKCALSCFIFLFIPAFVHREYLHFMLFGLFMMAILHFKPYAIHLLKKHGRSPIFCPNFWIRFHTPPALIDCPLVSVFRFVYTASVCHFPINGLYSCFPQSLIPVFFLVPIFINFIIPFFKYITCKRFSYQTYNIKSILLELLERFSIFFIIVFITQSPL